MKKILIIVIVSVLLWGCSNRYFEAVATGDLQTVEAYIEKGKDVNKRGAYDMTALHVAAKYGRSEIARFLISKGVVDVNAKDKYGWTPLFYAAYYGNSEVAEVLISHGANVNAKSKRGRTPLHYAAMKNNSSVAKLLISHGADLNAKDNKNYTILHAAAYGGLTWLVKLCIDKGIDVNLKDDYGKTPIQYAIDGYKDELNRIREMILRNRREKNPLYKTYTFEDTFYIKYYILLPIKQRYNEVLDILNGALTKIIASAVDSGNWEKVDSILDGIKIKELKSYYIKILSQLLFIFAEKGNSNAIETILSQGVDVNSKSENGWTLLHWVAAGNGDTATARILLSYDADINAKDKDGCTPLHIAVKNGNLELVKFLISHGAYVNAKNNKGETPLKLAEKNGHSKVANILRAAGGKK